jgi:mitogen-activated protein kinase 1/3
MMWQAMAGLNYMIESGLMHRDLKPENILVRTDCVVKLVDFGFGRPVLGEEEEKEIMKELTEPHEGKKHREEYFKTRQRRLSTHIVTRWYRAPEISMCDYIYGDASDLWSMGAIFGEMVQLLHEGKRQPLFNAVASRLSPLSNMNKAKPDCPQVELICETIGACAALQC